GRRAGGPLGGPAIDAVAGHVAVNGEAECGGKQHDRCDDGHGHATAPARRIRSWWIRSWRIRLQVTHRGHSFRSPLPAAVCGRFWRSLVAVIGAGHATVSFAVAGLKVSWAEATWS